jgi:hypothetical protein
MARPSNLSSATYCDRRIALGQPQLAPHAAVEVARAAGLDVGLGADRQHRHLVPHLGEAFQHLAADALRGRIGHQQLGCCPPGLQLAEQLVVLGVRDLRFVEHVVAVRVVVQQLAQRLHALLHLGGSGHGFSN